MPEFDLIIVGVGPAGAALGYRATQRGWRVLGIDPTTSWDKTLGLWADEIPDWLQHLPVTRSTPSVHTSRRRSLQREYAIIDGPAWRAGLVSFPVEQEAATIVDAHTVTTETGGSYRARWVVDTRGPTAQPGAAAQQALGLFSQQDEQAVWMDLRQTTPEPPPSFCYQIPTPRGMLNQETILITRHAVPWEELERRLAARGIANTNVVEKVLFPMDIAPYTGPAVPFGARAGLLNPVTGYSVGTALSLVDATVDALSTGARLPWEQRGFRLDRHLLRRAQRVLLDLEPADTAEFFDALFQLPTETQRRFLTLGDWWGTVKGMWQMFIRADIHLKKQCLKLVRA